MKRLFGFLRWLGFRLYLLELVKMALADISNLAFLCASFVSINALTCILRAYENFNVALWRFVNCDGWFKHNF